MSGDLNCRLGDLFESRREKGRAGLPLLSVTMNDGLVDRDDLARKQETSLSPEEHLLVKPGDIAYNMMRMWQGAYGLATREGLVSPAYVVLKPNARIVPEYAAYLLRTPRMLHLMWAYSYGLTDDRLRLYYPDFAAIRVRVPGVAEQIRIAHAMRTWDDAKAITEQLVENAKRQQRALLQRLLPRHGEHEAPPTGWTIVRLGDVATLNPARPKRPVDGRVSFLPMDAVSESGRVTSATVRAYEDVCTGYTGFADGDLLVAKITPCFENGKGALVSGLINGVGFGSTEFHVLRPSNEVDRRLLAHVLQSHEFRRRGESEMEGSAGQKRVGADFLRSFRFLCPVSNEAQRKIADMLDSAGTIAESHRSGFVALELEKRSLMNQLLTGKGRLSFKAQPAETNA